MKKNILIPTDFSDNAWSAAVYAFKLYAEQEATFYFLNSSTLPHGESRSIMTTRLTDTMYRQAKEQLMALKDQAETARLSPNHEYQTLLSTDDLLETIKNAIDRYDIDLVVMGTKGATGANKFFFGSNTVRMVQNINNSPLLMVPEDFEFKPPKHIAFPTDYKRAFDDKELRPLFEFAKLHDAHIYVLHINEKKNLDDQQDHNMATLQKHLGNFQYSFHWMPDYNKKSEVINDFIQDLHIDALAMVNYRHSIIEKITKEPIIKKIGYQPTIPFLVFAG